MTLPRFFVSPAKVQGGRITIDDPRELHHIQDVLRLFAEYREADLLIVGAGSYEGVLRDQARGLPHTTYWK